jgi:hypothetical protein
MFTSSNRLLIIMATQEQGGTLPPQPEQPPSKPVPSPWNQSGRPQGVAQREDAKAAGVPEGAVITKVEKVPFVGPPKPGYERPVITRYTYTVPTQEPQPQSSSLQPTSTTPLRPSPSRTSIPSTKEVYSKPVATELSINSGIPGPLNPYSGLLRPAKPILANPNDPVVREKISRGFTVSTAIVSTISAPATAATGALLGTGISEVMSVATRGKLLDVYEIPKIAMESATFAVISGGVMNGLSSKLPFFSDAFVGQAIKSGNYGSFIGSMTSRAAVNAGLGAGGNFIVSGGNSEALIQGAEFGAAFSIAGDVFRGASVKTGIGQKISDKATKLKEDIFGVKAKELVGMDEVYREDVFPSSPSHNGEELLIEGATPKDMIFKKTVPTETNIRRISQLDVDETVLRGSEIDYYRQYNLDTLKKPTLDLAGTQDVTKLKPGFDNALEETKLYAGTFEETRNAKPYIDLLKGKEVYMEKATQIDVLSAPELGTKSLTKIESGEGTIIGNTEPSLLLSKKTTGYGFDDSTTSKFAVRKITGVQVQGTIDDVVVRDLSTGGTNLLGTLPEGEAQNLYGKMGGGAKQGSSYLDKFTKVNSEGKTVWTEPQGKMEPLGGSKGDVVPGSKITEQFNIDQAKIKAGISPSEYEAWTAKSGAMKPGTNEYFTNTLKNVEASNSGNTASLTTEFARPQTQTSVQKQITLSRVIFDVAPREIVTLPRIPAVAMIGGLRAIPEPTETMSKAVFKSVQAAPQSAEYAFYIPSESALQNTLKSIVTPMTLSTQRSTPLNIIVPRQVPMQYPEMGQVQETKETPITKTDVPTMPSLREGFNMNTFNPGFKFEGSPFDMFTPPRKGGLYSRKRRYPIMTPQEMLGM